LYCNFDINLKAEDLVVPERMLSRNLQLLRAVRYGIDSC